MDQEAGASGSQAPPHSLILRYAMRAFLAAAIASAVFEAGTTGGSQGWPSDAFDTSMSLFGLCLVAWTAQEIRWRRSGSVHLGTRLSWFAREPPSGHTAYLRWCESRGLEPYAAGDDP